MMMSVRMYSTAYVSTLTGNDNMVLSLIQGTGVYMGIRSNPNTPPRSRSGVPRRNQKDESYIVDAVACTGVPRII
jgi:hypothetical protein